MALRDFYIPHSIQGVMVSPLVVLMMPCTNLLLNDNGNPCFLNLNWNDKRNLNLTKRAGKWNDNWWFAVVRKSSFSPVLFLCGSFCFQPFLPSAKHLTDLLQLC
jgi:hypothetical protein